jgi:hypothetical protein
VLRSLKDNTGYSLAVAWSFQASWQSMSGVSMLGKYVTFITNCFVQFQLPPSQPRMRCWA